MKRILMSIAIVALSITATQAQVNKTVKEESTVKRVITKEGSDVKVKEIKNTDTESGAVIVKNDNQTNQEFKEATKMDSDKKVLVDETNIDQQNETMIAEKKVQLQAQLESSKRDQAEAAAKKKLEYDAKQAQMQKDLADRRARLESRPKGMSKLKKN